MRTAFDTLVNRRKKEIAVSLVIVCLLGVGFFFAYRSLKKTGATSVYFNMESDLPDPSAELKYGTIGDKQALNVMKPGKAYTISFTVLSGEKTPTEYSYVIESKAMKGEGRFNLNPGQNKTVNLTLNLDEGDKWVYDRTDVTTNENNFDLANSSWLGERIDYQILGSENSKAYTYAPVTVDFGAFKKALNLNLTLDDLRTNPHERYSTSIMTKEGEKDDENNSLQLSVNENKLNVNMRTVRVIYKNTPELFRIMLYKGDPAGADKYIPKPRTYNLTTSDTLTNGRMPATIGFWYQIR
jgi:hypothetical protein